MKNWTNSALVGVMAAASTLGLQSAAAQVQSRGVMVLRPGGTPQPAPTPPAPKPTPVPTPVVKPAPAILPAPVIKACPRPFARPDLTLTDGAGFDRKLRAKMSARGNPIVVDLATSYPADGAPSAALAPWLAAIRSSNGQVTIQTYCQDSRGMFGNFFKRLFVGNGEPKTYQLAANYDAVLQVDGLDQRVTQVAFVRRAGK